MNYSEQLKSPKWQKKRLEILNLKGFKCEVCGSKTKTLNVHHRFYIKGRMPWEYDNDVFQVFCEDCHERTHEKKKNLQEMEKYIELFLIIEDESSKDDDFYKKIIHVFTNLRENEYNFGSLSELFDLLVHATCADRLLDDCMKLIMDNQIIGDMQEQICELEDKLKKAGL